MSDLSAVARGDRPRSRAAVPDANPLFDKVSTKRANPAGWASMLTSTFGLGFVGQDQLMYQFAAGGRRVEEAHGNLHIKRFGKAGFMHSL